MREQRLRPGLLHLEDGNLSSDFSENFDFAKIAFRFLGRLYAITGLYLCSCFTAELLERCNKSQWILC